MKGRKILVVDDNPMNVEVMQESLSDDYALEVAVSGEETLETITWFKPEIVLLDIMMPGMDGYEVCRRIRQIPGIRSTKVIMVSAKAMESERIEGYESGADDYIVKPFSHQELRAKIKVYLNLKSEEEMNEIKSDLLLLLSHETNTPLNSIKGFAELLLQTNLDQRQRDFVSTIVEAENSLESFIKKALLLSGLRGTEIKIEYNPEPVDRLLREAINQIASLAREKDITFSFMGRITENILCQKILMQSAFKYILENAVKFSETGQKVSIRTHQEKGYCVVEIMDQGQGIKNDNIERIFEPFSVQDLEHHHSGHGLSLAIARNIVTHHGGTLQAVNNQNGGATFLFRLPLYK